MSMRGRSSYSIVTALPVYAAFAIVLTLVTCGWCCSSALAQEQQHGTPPCGGEAIARGTVNRVGDGRTFTLSDGREVRLAAVEVPLMPLPKEPDPAPGGTAARRHPECADRLL